MQKSKESGYSFKINMGDRLFHLMCDSESERVKYLFFLFLIYKMDKRIYIFDFNGKRNA